SQIPMAYNSHYQQQSRKFVLEEKMKAFRTWCVFVCALCVVPWAFSQAAMQAQLNGSVTYMDSDGKALEKVSIHLKNTVTNQVYNTYSDLNGRYNFTNLPPGKY